MLFVTHIFSVERNELLKRAKFFAILAQLGRILRHRRILKELFDLGVTLDLLFDFFKKPQLLFLSVALLELLDSSGAVDELLLTREERMAVRADFDADVRLGRTRVDHIATVAGDRGLDVLGMYLLFH